jgi:hypothetical protein
MDALSYFESRSGKLSCNAEEVYNFVTDLRNFERFAPGGSVNNWKADKEFCSFDVMMVGSVTVKISEKEEYNKVVYSGDALKKNDFLLTLFITENGKNSADVKIQLSADLNPMMKMIAAKPIAQFMDMLITEMENFRGWDTTKV